MKMRIFIFLIVLFSFMYKVDARYEVINPLCTNEEKLNLRNSAIKTSYYLERYTEGNEQYYKLTLLNTIDEINIIYGKDKIKDYIYKLNTGTTITLNMIANEKSLCENYNIYSKTIRVPDYNPYHSHELCKGNEEYVFCKEDSSAKFSEDEFVRLIKEYIKNKNKVDEEKPGEVIEEPKTNELDKYLNFLYNNYIYILISIIVLGTTGIIIISVKKRRELSW